MLPATAIVNYKNCKVDIDRNLYYLRIGCDTVCEAKRRALVLAYLTYDMTRNTFVKLLNASMLENPYDYQNIYDVSELYSLQAVEEAVNVKAMMAK